MKQVYHMLLTLLTIAMLALLTFDKLNQMGNWVDLSAYTDVIKIVGSYGPMVLVCLFAFGNLFGRVLSKFMFIIIALLLVLFSIAMFAPHLLSGIIGGGESTGSVIKLIQIIG